MENTILHLLEKNGIKLVLKKRGKMNNTDNRSCYSEKIKTAWVEIVDGIFGKIREEIQPYYDIALDRSSDPYYGGEYNGYVNVFSILERLREETQK